MSDAKFTKIAGSLLYGVRDLVNWGIAGDHTSENELRLTVAARTTEVKKLMAPVAEGGAGLSQRKAAKLLGVSHTQVQRDMALNVPENGTKCAIDADSEQAPEKPKPPKPKLDLLPGQYATIVIDPPWPMAKIASASPRRRSKRKANPSARRHGN